MGLGRTLGESYSTDLDIGHDPYPTNYYAAERLLLDAEHALRNGDSNFARDLAKRANALASTLDVVTADQKDGRAELIDACQSTLAKVAVHGNSADYWRRAS